jgi:L-asparaginase
MKSSILIIYTGGTIGMKNDAETGALVPFDFSGIYDEFPSLKRLNVDIDVLTMDPVIDSSNVTPANWAALAELIRDNYTRYDGFVVLHGTDTMSYTASALSFMLENLAKPVVFTGSQIPIGVLRTDGRENLITAIEIAGAHIGGRPEVPEVSLYFQNCLFRANRTTKRSSEDLSAFWSYNYPALADVGVNITYHTEYILQPERYDEPLHIAARLSGGIAVVKLFPGIEERTLRAMLSAEGLRGVVLETFGAGNAPTCEWFIRVLKEAIDRGVIILNITQCGGGKVSMELYETGLRLQKIGVLCGHDMTTEAAVTKLMYVLGLGLSDEQTRALLRRPLRGEFTA